MVIVTDRCHYYRAKWHSQLDKHYIVPNFVTSRRLALFVTPHTRALQYIPTAPKLASFPDPTERINHQGHHTRVGTVIVVTNTMYDT
jgi:hypothetical protein